MGTYDENYYESNGSNGDRIALRWYAKLIERTAPAGPALDFGSGPGWMVRRMGQTRPCDGVEISEYSRSECGIRNPKATIYSSISDVPDDAYAAVLAIHVLEHIPKSDVQATIGEIRRVLIPGGVLLMVTPDAGGEAARTRGSDWRALTDPTHINLQGYEYWRQSLADSDLQILEDGSDGLWDPPYTNWVVDRLRLPRIALAVYSGRLTVPVGRGESYVAMARRPASP